MKFLTGILLFLGTTTSTGLFGQESGVSIHLFTGYGVNNTNHGMAKFGGDVQYHFANSLFAGLQVSAGVNGNRTITNNIVWNRTFSLQFGKTTSISEQFSVQPYIGLGFQKVMRTDYTFADPANPADDFMSKATNKAYTTFNEDKASAKRYGMSEHVAFGVPVGVNFLIHKKTYGLTLGTYLFASKYSEVGLRLGIAFGSLR
jgi:hypothetical protein